MHRVVADTFKERLALPIFRYYENEILFLVHFPTRQTPHDIPRNGQSVAEARSVSRPGKARRYAVKSLDTDLRRLGT
jgi:hypothetical protein